MKTATQVSRYLIYLLGAFFILMSFDCFGNDPNSTLDTFWEKLACFLISSLPGLAVILLNYLLRKNDLVLGVILLAMAVGSVFLFKFYIEPLEKIITILTVLIPLIGVGTLLIIARNRY